MTAPSKYGGSARYYPEGTDHVTEPTPYEPKRSGRGRPGTPCAHTGCTELTRSTQGRCAKHRPKPTVRLHNGDWISVGPIQFKAAVARQLADEIHDVLDRAGL